MKIWKDQFSSVTYSVMSNSSWPHGLQHTRPPCPSPTPSLLKLMSIELVIPSNHLILCHPLLLLPSIFLSIRVFSNESVLHIRWPKYWSFRFNISPSNEHSGLISFRMDWLDCCITNHPKTERHRVTINMYFLTLFQRIRNLGAGCLG